MVGIQWYIVVYDSSGGGGGGCCGGGGGGGSGGGGSGGGYSWLLAISYLMSPYPTVVMVTTAHQNASGMDLKND